MITLDGITVSTNDKSLHRGIKMRAAELNTTLGKLVDIYLKVGFEFELHKEENLKKLQEVFKRNDV